MHRKEVKLVDGVYIETGKEKSFNAPFYNYPLITSHVPPHLMALNAGEKLNNLSHLEMNIFKKTYSHDTICLCARLREFYDHITHGVPSIRQKGDSRSPAKRLKMVHTPTSKIETRRITRGHFKNEDTPSQPIKSDDDTDILPSIAGPLFQVASPPACNARCGSSDMSVEGLDIDNFTGHPFDYIDPVKATQIIHLLLALEQLKPEEDIAISVGTSPSTPAPRARSSRPPRLSLLSSPSDKSYYTPSRPPIQPVLVGRNTNQKANVGSEPTLSKNPIPKRVLATIRKDSSSPIPGRLSTRPISRRVQAATVAAVSIAPSLVGRETVSVSPSCHGHGLSITPPSRLPSPPSRFRRPSRRPGRPSLIPLASSQARPVQTNLKDVLPRNGRH